MKEPGVSDGARAADPVEVGGELLDPEDGGGALDLVVVVVAAGPGLVTAVWTATRTLTGAGAGDLPDGPSLVCGGLAGSRMAEAPAASG